MAYLCYRYIITQIGRICNDLYVMALDSDGGFIVIFLSARHCRLILTPLQHKAIFAANHCGARGPFNLTTAFRKINHNIMTWSSWETGGNLKDRWNYFYHIFYRKKLHYPAPVAWMSAMLVAPVYPIIFRYAGLIPVYRGTKIKRTYN